MSVVGDRLKIAREEADISLKKFADLSKIQLKYLEKLEGGEFNKLPASVYIHGFLGKYSQILNLPLEELLAEYEKETEQARMLKEKEGLALPSIKSPKIIITPKKISWVIALIIILLIVGYLIYQLDFLISAPKLEVDYPAQDLTINRSLIEISGRSDQSAKLTVNGEQVYIEKDGTFRQEINLSPGVNTLKIEAVNRFGKKSEIMRQIVVQ